MSRPTVGSPTEAVLQRARYVLFVEGQPERDVLDEFLPPEIQVKQLGPSFGLRAAASALRTEHPEYCFLIDRDRRDDASVESTWQRFPEPHRNNLLIWRRKEFENYFLIPEYLQLSSYRKPDADLRESIRLHAMRTLYRDAANLVIVDLCSRARSTEIDLFHNHVGLETKAAARQSLLARQDFSEFAAKAGQLLSRTTLGEQFDQTVELMTRGVEPVEFESGRWLELVSGKDVLPSVINECFRVRNMQDRPLQGDEARLAVMLDLIRHPLSEQPPDFQELHRLVRARLAI